MSNSMRACLAGVMLLGSVVCGTRISGRTTALVLAGVRLEGTDQLNPEDVIRGLDLQMNKPTTKQNLSLACDQLQRLRIFASVRCVYAVHEGSVWLTLLIKPGSGPVVFDNFVWTSKPKLSARLKQDIPLFMPELPERSGLTSDIIRVLQQVVDERGIKGRVRYDANFWTERAMNVFYIEGISTPVTALQIEGKNAPSPEEIQKFSEFYIKENFSAARLTWVIQWVIRDLYKPRGYLRPAIAEPQIQSLGERDSTFPVRVVLHISSGDRYVFGSVQFLGLAKPHASLLLSKWKLTPGEPYNETYVENFISTEILGAPWAVHSKTESDVAFPCATIDPATKEVSLTVTVEPPRKTYSFPKHSGFIRCGNAISTLTLPSTR